MDVITIASAPTGPAAFKQATRAVNAWRGEVVECFARTEVAVTETLLALAGVPDRGAKVKLNRLVGQRLQDLANATASDGPFASEGKAASTALADFRRHEPLRATLCHGTAKVALDRKGEWLALFKLVALKGRQAERSSLTIEEQEAGAMLLDLTRCGQRLASVLGNLRKTIAG